MSSSMSDKVLGFFLVEVSICSTFYSVDSVVYESTNSSVGFECFIIAAYKVIIVVAIFMHL
jgi:hypothetical protein